MHSTRLPTLVALATLAASGLFISLLSGCGGASGVRVTEGSEQIGAAPTGSIFAASAATIVHVDTNERLVTLRNARGFPGGTFLETEDRLGAKTGTLKARENRAIGLRTADILEGSPEINNRAVPLSPAESERLGEIYPD